MRLSIFSCVLFAGFLAACDGGGAGTGPLSAADAEDGCRRMCEHDEACDPGEGTVAECTTDCVDDVAGWVRADAFENIIDCTTALACSASDDECLSECAPTSAHERYEAQCRTFFGNCDLSQDQIDSACETTPTSEGTGDQGFFCLIAPSIVDEMTACIPTGATCQAGIACVSAVLETHGIDS